MDIRTGHADGLSRANAVIDCLEALALREHTPAWEPIQFKRPGRYGPTWSTYKGYRNFEYGMDAEGMVHMRGMMSGCPSGESPIFTLPEGYRPTYRIILSTIGGASNERARVDVQADGDVFFWWSGRTRQCPAPSGAPAMWLTLEGLTFEGEQ